MGIWIPSAEAELRDVLAAGDAPEGHFLDLKRELGGNDRARKETAQDIASFALDGGVLIVGVDEPTTGTYELSPQPLANLSERAEQIAANRYDPGLFVRTTVIASAADPTAGYLIIEVPPSPAAPHMVDGRYWGRSERTKRRLGDAEVARLHTSRAASDRRVLRALEEELERDPRPRSRGRMIFVAEPLAADPGVARALIRRTPTLARDLAHCHEELVPASVRDHPPTAFELSTSVRRAKGVALTHLADGRRTPDDSFRAEVATDVEIQTTGSIRGLMSRLTYTDLHPRLPQDTERISESLPIAWTHRLVIWAGALGADLDY